jgi:hypothetical protein
MITVRRDAVRTQGRAPPPGRNFFTPEETTPRLFLPVAERQEAKPSMQRIDCVIHSRPSGVLTVPLA